MRKVYLYHPLNESQPPDHWSDNLQSYNTWSNLDDASCTEIYCNGMYYTEDEIQRLTTKLRHNGVITLVGPDIVEMGRALQTGYLLPIKLRELASNNKLYTCLEIVELLEKSGLKILKKRINNFMFTIQAKRL